MRARPVRVARRRALFGSRTRDDLRGGDIDLRIVADRRIPGAKAWRLMREAEALLDEPAPECADLDRLERALGLVREVREIHARMAAPKRHAG